MRRWTILIVTTTAAFALGVVPATTLTTGDADKLGRIRDNANSILTKVGKLSNEVPQADREALAADAQAIIDRVDAILDAPAPPPPPPSAGFTVVGAGDLCGGCLPTGDVAESLGPDLVLTFGDNAYPDGSDANFADKYQPRWGRFDAIVRPSPGNHDWRTNNANGYRAYFGIGPGPLYGSFDANGWHFVTMDTTSPIGSGSAQLAFIQDDLAADAHTCEIAYGHHPRWSSGAGHGSQTFMDAAWETLVDGGVDVVLVAHDHLYERFTVMDRDGAAAASGTRQFTVGTGGAKLSSFGTPLPTSEVRVVKKGVIELTLEPSSYSWRFVDVNGAVRDSGSGTCRA